MFDHKLLALLRQYVRVGEEKSMKRHTKTVQRTVSQTGITSPHAWITFITTDPERDEERAKVGVKWREEKHCQSLESRLFFPPLTPSHHCYFNAAVAVSVQWGDRKMKVWVQRANRCEDGGMDTKVWAIEWKRQPALFSQQSAGETLTKNKSKRHSRGNIIQEILQFCFFFPFWQDIVVPAHCK